MGKKPLAYYLDLIKSAGNRREWLKAKRYGETALKKLPHLTYSPLEEYFLYYRLGYIYDDFADYSRSLDFFYKAHLTASQNNLKESYIAYSVNLIGLSFLRIKSVDNALKQFKKADEYFKKYGTDTEPMNKMEFINHLIYLGYCYLYKDDLIKTGELIEEISTYLPAMSQHLISDYHHLNGEYLIATNEYEKSRESINKFIAHRQEANLIRDVLEGKTHLAIVDLLEGNIDSAIKDLTAIFKESKRKKQNDFVCATGLLLGKCYSIKNLPEKSAKIEKQIKPTLNTLDIAWMYEQLNDFEQLYEKLKIIYKKEAADYASPAVLTDTFKHHHKDLSFKNRILGESGSMREIYRLIENIAKTDLPVLIQGETGTGKELVARTIHLNSLRTRNSWLALNCTSIPESLLENELFGHIKGTFTDAHQDKKGYIESASEGTLFLDEISEMPAAMQQKLLRVLEEKLVWRLGAEKPTSVNTRFIFASNRNIEELIKSKKFREDLFYRINAIVINLPPLRERKDDIPLLITHFLTKYYSIKTPNTQRLTPDAIALLQGYHWPGNIRELENEIKRICALYPKEGLITEEMLSAPIRKGNRMPIRSKNTLKELKNEYEKNLIIETLNKCKGNISHAARELGCLRPHLSKRIKELNISPFTDVTKR